MTKTKLAKVTNNQKPLVNKFYSKQRSKRMANFNDPTHNSQHLGILGELNFDGINSMNANTSKEMPPINPLAVTSGMYIPPEETQQMEQHDDVTRWGLSDDQNDSDDDEMDGNEFDLDFDDAEFLPPLNYDTQHMNMNTHSQTPETTYQQSCDPSSSLYMSSSSTNPSMNSNMNSNMNSSMNMNQFQSSPFNTMQQPQNKYLDTPAFDNSLLYTQSNHAPLEFINPSRLQLPQDETQQIGYLDSSIGLNTPQYGQMDVDDMNLDMEFDDLYPMYRSEDASFINQGSEDPSRNSEPFTTPPADASVSERINDPFKHNSLPQQSLFDTYPSNTQPEQPQEQPQQPLPSPPMEQVSLPSPPADSPLEKKNQPRRKTRATKLMAHDEDPEYENAPPSRRKGRKSAPQTVGHSAHVCDKLYPDGTQCHRSFTRPYDLARHQETLHASVRKTFTCQVCGSDSKTFSRLDALSRHMRLKHPSE